MSYTWEPYEASTNVILTRETTMRVRELVGTLRLGEFTDQEELRDELICRIFQAIIGTSRLPVTSEEAPLPEFSLGQLSYLYSPMRPTGNAAIETLPALLARGFESMISQIELVKLLEILLRGCEESELPLLSQLFKDRWQAHGGSPQGLVGLFRTLFDEVSLTPYTNFVTHVFAFLRHLRRSGWLTASRVLDFTGYLIRQIARHLTSYDLVRFHHQGANYPDALLLDTQPGELLQLLGVRRVALGEQLVDAAGQLSLLERQPFRFATEEHLVDLATHLPDANDAGPTQD